MKRCLLAAASTFTLCILSACGGGTGSATDRGGDGSQVATHFALVAPSTASVSSVFTFTVVALDSSNKTVAGYSGTLHFTSTDPQAMLLGNSTLTNGTAIFAASLKSPGLQTITATDTVTAGITGSSNPIEVANPNLHGFQPTGDMGTERASHTATLLANGKVLITGGYNNTEVLATAELFDPATGTFTATGTMKEVRSEHTATLLANGRVLVVGGAADNVAELFDPVTGTFAPTTGQLTTGGRWGCTATLLNDGTVLIAGGRDALDVWDAFSLNNAELFNPGTGTFKATGGMTEVRYDHTAALLQNGEVLITGGFNGQPLSSAELFDPVTGSFSATGAMSALRAEHTATLLDDGTVLVTGGFTYDAPGSFSSADIFDPTTSTFTPVGPMGAARFSHTATRLNSSQVLITGGVSSTTIPEVFASSADLY